MVLLALESEIPKKKNLDPPFTLVLQRNVLGPVWKTDVGLCVELAQTSDQWSVAVCKLEDVTNLRQFLISSEEVFDKNDLILLSRQIKEQQLAVRAAALARGREKKNDNKPEDHVDLIPRKLPTLLEMRNLQTMPGPLIGNCLKLDQRTQRNPTQICFSKMPAPKSQQNLVETLLQRD